jgi:hypothetical protein
MIRNSARRSEDLKTDLNVLLQVGVVIFVLHRDKGLTDEPDHYHGTRETADPRPEEIGAAAAEMSQDPAYQRPDNHP